MAYGGSINHPKSVFRRKQQLKQCKIKKINNSKLKKKGAKRRYIDALTTTHILNKTRTNPTTNITLSGKKRRLLLKQLKREETEKQKMDVVVVKKPKIESKLKKVQNNHDGEKMDMS